MFSILNSDLCFDIYHGFISMENSLMPDDPKRWDTHDPNNTDDDRDDWDGEYPNEEYPEEEDGIMESDLFDNDLEFD